MFTLKKVSSVFVWILLYFGATIGLGMENGMMALVVEFIKFIDA